MALINGTGVNTPSAFLVNTLDSISQKLIHPKLGDLVFKPGTALWYLNRYAKNYREGAEIVYPLITSKITTRGSFYGDQLLSTATIDAIQPANQVWRFYWLSMTLPLTDITLGRGGPGGVDIIRDYMQIGSASFLDMMAEAVYGNSPFNSAIDIDNLNNWFTTGNTIAGINRATTTAWNPQTASSIGGHLTPQTLLPAYYNCVFGYDEPDVMVLNNADFANFELAFTNTSSSGAQPLVIRAGDNIADNAPIQGGFRYHMRYKNLSVLADQHLAAGTGYILNTKYIWMIYNLNDHFNLTPWLMPSNQHVISSL